MGINDAGTDYIFDGNDTTVWHQSRNSMPIELTVDMGNVYTLKGFTYLPDQDVGHQVLSLIIFLVYLRMGKIGKM